MSKFFFKHFGNHYLTAAFHPANQLFAKIVLFSFSKHKSSAVRRPGAFRAFLFRFLLYICCRKSTMWRARTAGKPFCFIWV